ncbi:MAG TPA: serine/threonine protein kinase [Chloroflexi bacterium]|nr:serine/threonine protein kinase [Chloroflexota bacterium]
MSDDLIGKLLGKYELRERIGRGGMAEVYKAYHASLDRYVALKILHPFLGRDPEFKERFEREARNVAQLRHPNIVQVYDFDFDPVRELYYMVMEYINGPTLRTRLMQLSLQGEHFTIPEALRITRSLASALAYAHSRDMIHRDIKPGNIMIDADGRVVLTDFGIARIVSGPNMTASGSMVGTPAYMSPEQGLGQPGDHRSDIYSLGVVLYQLVTGTTPYDADTPIAIVLKHVNDPLPPPSNINPDIPEGLERILYKALAKSPDDRYQSIEEMLRHLDDLDAASAIVLPPEEPFGHISQAPVPEIPAAEKVVVEEPVRVAPPQERRSRTGCLVWVLLIVLSLAAMGSGAYLSFTGLLGQYVPFIPDVEIVLTATPTEAEPVPAGSELLLTPIIPGIRATESVPASGEPSGGQESVPSPSPTPDMTATVASCNYGYALISQTPEDGLPYPEVTSLTKRITILNKSRCPFGEGTRLVFLEGEQLGGPNLIEFGREVEPGEEFEIVLRLQTPAYQPGNDVIRSTWVILLPDETQVGPPLTFELRLFPSP